MDLEAADARTGGAKARGRGESAAVGWGRAGETPACVVWGRGGFCAEGVGSGGAGGCGADGGGERACYAEPEAAAEVAPIEERDG